MEISLSWELMLLVFFLFIICIFLLDTWLYKPILKFMDARDDMIKNDMENANSNDSNIEHIQNEIAHILEEAKKEAAFIKEQATTQAKSIYDNKIQELQSNNDKDFVAFTEQLQRDKEELKQSLLMQMPEFQTILANKLKQL